MAQVIIKVAFKKQKQKKQTKKPTDLPYFFLCYANQTIFFLGLSNAYINWSFCLHMRIVFVIFAWISSGDICIHQNVSQNYSKLAMFDLFL